LEGLAIWREEFERMPDRHLKAFILGNVALRVGYPEEAYQALLHIDLDDPYWKRPLPWWMMAQAAHYTGRFQEELEVARHGMAKNSNTWSLRRFEIRALAAMDRMNEIGPLVAELEGMEPAFGVNPGDQLSYAAADLGRLGKPEYGQDLARRALSWWQDRDPDAFLADRAAALLFLGQSEEALSLIGLILDQDPGAMDARGLHGIALAQLGNRPGAESEMAWLEELEIPYQLGRNTEWRAAILAHLGDRNGAAQLVGQSLEEGRMWRAIQTDWRFAPLWGHEGFEEVMAPKG
jgi:tetratricopeptide (TPR) repeat protein